MAFFVIFFTFCCRIGLNRTADEVTYTEGEARYKCDNCGRSYKNKCTLTQHSRNECGQIPQFECNICDYKCNRKSNFKRHYILLHYKELP
ncbi:hypothetical protein LSTR_LSTR016253 [Laodelphax striatellus]|uniref:C2H2-type domain-containing protein n=1 Tax=Laodelphax striatellus TaxID=195883 RepID=A0A482WHV2_LAOST|nr:hypothetical protein LSTR_LSTR016253 [Laodelphax striatellus]